MLNGLILSLQVVMWGVFLYFFILSIFGWVKKKEIDIKEFPVKSRFAILVAAHNEEAVIGEAVRSLKKLNYPKELYDIFVIADNCDDNTSMVARKNGAIVYERFDNVKRGKGFSLEWMFKKLFAMDKEYDAVCVLDADNLVSSNFLMEMNKHLCMGHKVVQGYLDSKNPYDSWISGNNSIAFWISNRLVQLPRYYMGLSCILGGTGFIVATDILKEIGWGATCLVEDLEFTLKLILRGNKVYWAHDAVIYDEKPLTLKQSWRQRKRWMQGHFDCVGRFFKKLLVKAIKEKNPIAFDSLMYLAQPVVVVVSGAGVLLSVLFGILNILYLTFGWKLGGFELIYIQDASLTIQKAFMGFVSCVFLYISVFFVIIEGKMSKRIIKYLLLMPIYNLTWVPIIVKGFMDRDKREWTHTLHTRAMEISDIESLEKVG